MVNMRRIGLHISRRYLRTPFMPPKRTLEDRYRVELDRHKHRRLAMAEPDRMPQTYKLTHQLEKPEVRTQERKLPSLAESAPPYAQCSEKGIKELQNYETYYDPLFNPHLHEERHRVDPDQEPFSAIYSNSKSEFAHEYTGVRNITTPVLWEHVERLARVKVAPEVMRRKPGEFFKLPSGFVPPPESPPDLPYFVRRTRNHLLPVYFHLESTPDKCYTILRYVTGDLWKLESDIREYLEKKTKTKIITAVLETDGDIHFRGRHLHDIVDWLHKQGF